MNKKSKGIIHKPKCPKTVSGMHIWPQWYTGFYKCTACGLVDDLIDFKTEEDLKKEPVTKEWLQRKLNEETNPVKQLFLYRLLEGFK